MKDGAEPLVIHVCLCRATLPDDGDFPLDTYAHAILAADNGIILTVSVSPGSRREAFPAGYNEWRQSIHCHVTAPASGGKANRAVIEIIARTLGVPRTAASIVSGTSAALKRVRIEGISREEAVRILASAD